MVTPNDKLMQLREDFAWEVEESHREQIFSGASDAKKDATVLPTYDDYCQEYGGNDHEGEAGSSTGANVTNATAEPMPATTTVGTADHWNKEVLRRLVAACFRFLADCHRLRADLRLDLDTLQCLQRVSPTHFQATFSASGGLGPAATLLRLRGDGPSDHVVI